MRIDEITRQTVINQKLSRIATVECTMLTTLRLYSYFLFLFKPACCAEPVLVLAALDDLVDRVLIVLAVVGLEPDLLVG